MADSSLTKTFGLTGPRDLLAKLRSDIDRLRAPRDDASEEAYIALDCALGAWALVDWAWESLPQERADYFLPPADKGTKPDRGAPKRFRDFVGATVSDLLVCRLIATGGKHCVVRKFDDPTVFTGIDGNDKSAPEDWLWAYRRRPHAAILLGETMTLAYRVFDRAAREWEVLLNCEKIDVR